MKEERKMHRRKNIGAGIGLVLIILIVAYMFSPLPKREPLKEKVSRGEYLVSFINEKDNAFHDYLFAVRLYGGRKEELKDELKNLYFDKEITKVSKEMKEYVKENEPAINVIRKAIAKKNCVVPEVTGSNDLIPYLSKCRSLARIMVTEGKIREIDGDHKGAYQDYLDIMRFGGDISKGGVLINGLVSIAMDSTAISSMQSGLKKADAKTLEMVVDGLKEIEDNFVPYSKVLEVERKVLLNFAKHVTRKRINLKELIVMGGGKLEGNLLYKIKINAFWLYVMFNKNKMIRNMEDYTQKMIESADKPVYENEAKEFEENIPKDLISQILLHAFSRAKIRYANNYANLRGTRIRAAVELFRIRHKRMPSNLSELVTDGIIDEIPIDPFSNKPFQYIDGKIYSIGQDFKDDRASVKIEWGKNQNKGDIIF